MDKPFNLRYRCKVTGALFMGRKQSRDVCELLHPVTGTIIRYGSIKTRIKHFEASNANDKIGRKNRAYKKVTYSTKWKRNEKND